MPIPFVLYYTLLNYHRVCLNMYSRMIFCSLCDREKGKSKFLATELYFLASSEDLYA